MIDRRPFERLVTAADLPNRDMWYDPEELDPYLDALDAEIARLRWALAECMVELDNYAAEKYPGDHPHFVQQREYLHSVNPARLALNPEVDPDDYLSTAAYCDDCGELSSEDYDSGTMRCNLCGKPAVEANEGEAGPRL